MTCVDDVTWSTWFVGCDVVCGCVVVEECVGVEGMLVVGEFVVVIGEEVVGALVVGAFVVGEFVVGALVVGEEVVGAFVVGALVVGIGHFEADEVNKVPEMSQFWNAVEESTEESTFPERDGLFETLLGVYVCLSFVLFVGLCFSSYNVFKFGKLQIFEFTFPLNWFEANSLIKNQ